MGWAFLVKTDFKVGLLHSDPLEAGLLGRLIGLLPGERHWLVGLPDYAALGRIGEELVGPGHGLLVWEASFNDLGEAGFGLGLDVVLDADAVLKGDSE